MSQSQPRLKTSAMIASIADEGQATVPAPFGVALFVPMFSSRVDTAALFNKASTPEQLGAAVQGCVSAIHSTAVMQIISVVIGIAVCLMLPKIYADKKA